MRLIFKLQEDNVTRADTEHDPFVECYRAWMQEKKFSSGTGADYLASFSNTSGQLSLPCKRYPHRTRNSPHSVTLRDSAIVASADDNLEINSQIC